MSAASPRLKTRKSIGSPRAAASCAAATTGVPFASPSESTIRRPRPLARDQAGGQADRAAEIAAVAVDLLHELARLAELLGQPFDARLASVGDDPDPIAGRAPLLEQRDDLERASRGCRPASSGTDRRRRRRRRPCRRAAPAAPPRAAPARPESPTRTNPPSAGDRPRQRYSRTAAARSGAAAPGRGTTARVMRRPRAGASRHQLAIIAVAADRQQQPEQRIGCRAALGAQPRRVGERAGLGGRSIAQVGSRTRRGSSRRARTARPRRWHRRPLEDLQQPARRRRDELQLARLGRASGCARPAPQRKRSGPLRVAPEAHAHPFADSIVPAFGTRQALPPHLDEVRDQDRPVRRSNEVGAIEIEVEEDRRLVAASCQRRAHPTSSLIARGNQRADCASRERHRSRPDHAAERHAEEQRMPLLQHERSDEILGLSLAEPGRRRAAEPNPPRARRRRTDRAAPRRQTARCPDSACCVTPGDGARAP